MICVYAETLASTVAQCFIKSTTRPEYPYSLSYHAISLTKFGLSMIPASASKMHDRRSPSKSVDTKGSSLYPKNPFWLPSEFFLMRAQISSYVVAFFNLQVKSTTETSMVGTRNAIPVSLPAREGMTLVTALAAPVDDGMIFPEAARPPRQSLREEESTTAWVAVMAWTVVMRASSISNSSWMALTMGARPLVVQDAQDTKFSLPSYSLALTPMTMVWESSLAGAE